MLLSIPSVNGHASILGRNIGTSIMTLRSKAREWNTGDVDIWILRIKGFSYGINNGKWLLDGNDVSIIVCKDCTREEINVRRLDVEEGRC